MHPFEFTLDARNRTKEIDLRETPKKIHIEVSRRCNDVLLEQVDEGGNAKGSPLHKNVPDVKLKKETIGLRFTMNNFSSNSISITMMIKV